MPAANEVVHLGADMALDQDVAVIVQDHSRGQRELEFNHQSGS
jgi:hypothetical protein